MQGHRGQHPSWHGRPAWNVASRYAYASLNEEGAVLLAYDVTLVGGLSADAIEATLSVWSDRYGSPLDHIHGPRL